MGESKRARIKNYIKPVIDKITAHPPGFYGYAYFSLILIFSVYYFLEFMLFREVCERCGSFEFILRNLVDSLHFSVVTITTLGYGDILPLTILGKFVTALEALVGITLIGLFLNALSHQNTKEAQENERKIMRKELREELLEDFAGIATEVKESSREMISQVTGGNSYLMGWLWPAPNKANAFYLVIKNEGELPMLDIKIQSVFDAKGKSLPLQENTIDVLHASDEKVITEVAIAEGEVSELEITVVARNGYFLLASLSHYHVKNLVQGSTVMHFVGNSRVFEQMESSANFKINHFGPNAQSNWKSCKGL